MDSDTIVANDRAPARRIDGVVDRAQRSVHMPLGEFVKYLKVRSGASMRLLLLLLLSLLGGPTVTPWCSAEAERNLGSCDGPLAGSASSRRLL
jgi:hypothetical protein